MVRGSAYSGDEAPAPPILDEDSVDARGHDGLPQKGPKELVEHTRYHDRTGVLERAKTAQRDRYVDERSRAESHEGHADAQRILNEIK